MPEMTGVELAETIHTTCPALPVVLVTGYGNREALPRPYYAPAALV